eukprot:2049288-Pyramimonas_sp.AAC.1
MEGGVEFNPAEVAAQKKAASADRDPVRLTVQGRIDDPLSVKRQARDVAGRARLRPGDPRSDKDAWVDARLCQSPGCR